MVRATAQWTDTELDEIAAGGLLTEGTLRRFMERDEYIKLGTPRLLNSNIPAVSVINNAALTTVVNEIIPANALGTGGAVNLQFWAAWDNSSGSDKTFRVVLRWDGADRWDSTITLATGANIALMHMDLWVVSGGTNQDIFGRYTISGRAGVPAAGRGRLQDAALADALFDGDGSAVADMTVDQPIQVKVQHSAASFNCAFALYQGFLLLYPTAT